MPIPFVLYLSILVNLLGCLYLWDLWRRQARKNLTLLLFSLAFLITAWGHLVVFSWRTELLGGRLLLPIGSLSLAFAPLTLLLFWLGTLRLTHANALWRFYLPALIFTISIGLGFWLWFFPEKESLLLRLYAWLIAAPLSASLSLIFGGLYLILLPLREKITHHLGSLFLSFGFFLWALASVALPFLLRLPSLETWSLARILASLCLILGFFLLHREAKSLARRKARLWELTLKEPL